MAYTQKNNPFKSPLKQSTEFGSGYSDGSRAPSGAGNIKREMDWKYGHGDFASKEKRRKPGESKFNYDVRMRKEGRKATSTKPSSSYQAPDPKAEINVLGADIPSYGYQPQERNPGDLREQGRTSTSILPSAPGDPFEYEFNEEGNIMFKDTRKGGEAWDNWEFPKPHQEKAIRERYTGSETGDLSSWYGHDTGGWTGSYDRDPITGEIVKGTFSHTDFERKSYLPYDLAQKKYNPNYKGSKK